MVKIKITSDQSSHGLPIGSVQYGEWTGPSYGSGSVKVFKGDCWWYVNEVDYVLADDNLCEEECGEVMLADDPVNPSHYIDNLFEEELFEVMVSNFTEEELRGYCKGNALKYRIRAGRKSDRIEEDIQKALWYESKYLNR